MNLSDLLAHFSGQGQNPAYGDPSSGGFPMPDLSSLNNNVVVPQNFMGRPRLARGLDNALLSLATMQNSDTAGQNVGNVVRNMMGIDSSRASVNLNRQMAPYLSMEPLLKMQGQVNDMDYKSAQSDQARAMANYYRNGGKQEVNVDQYVDGNGKTWQLLPNGTARPIMVPDANGNASQLTGHIPGMDGNTELERQLDREDRERMALGQLPRTATERGQRMMDFYGTRSGAQTSQRYANTPGYIGDADKIQLEQQIKPFDENIKAINDPGDIAHIMWKLNHPGKNPDTELQNLQQQRQQLIDKYTGNRSSGGNGNSPQMGTVDIPQPLVSPVMNVPSGPSPTTMVGDTPVKLGGGASLADLQNAIVPPGPKAAAPAPAPKPSKPSPARPKSSRPRVSIKPDGTVSIN